MQLTREMLRGMVLDALNENEEGHIDFRPGRVMQLIRPVRVTPKPGGGWEGGEDSPGSRRGVRPRGSTSTILKPGTNIRILRAGKNMAQVQPLDDDGSTLVDPQTGQEITSVSVHINKVCAHCAGAYTTTKRNVPSSAQAAQPAVMRRPAQPQTRADVDAKMLELKREYARLKALRETLPEDDLSDLDLDA